MLCCICLASCQSEKTETEPQTYPVLSVTVSSVETTDYYPASIRGRQDIEIYPQVSGKIEKVFVVEGEHVRRGQTLFIIDQVPYLAALQTAIANQEAAKANVSTAQLTYDGKKELFDKYYDLLMVMAGSVVYVGDLGSGNVAKLANQIVVACNIAAVGEALAFAKKAGTDPELVYQAIRGGLAGSTVMDAKAPMMLSRNFKPGFRIELHIKDLNNALNAAHAIAAPVPLTGQLMEMMQALKADGYEKEDHSSLVKYYEKIGNVVVEPEKQ